MTDTPLIYTSKGNVPADTLTYHHEWTVTPGLIVFREFYTENATGDIIKDSSHSCILQGAQSSAQAGSF